MSTSTFCYASVLNVTTRPLREIGASRLEAHGNVPRSKVTLRPAVVRCSKDCEGGAQRSSFSRRQAISIPLLAGAFGLAAPSTSWAAIPKTKGLPIEKIKEIIERDIVVGKYFVTGDLTTSIYRDDCRFKDPTNDVRSLQRYLDAVSLLFDPQMSTFELTDIRVSGPNTVEASWLLAGYLKFPWHPVVQQFAGTTKYTVDGDGLIEMHEETWSISPLTALVETFTPGRLP